MFKWTRLGAKLLGISCVLRRKRCKSVASHAHTAAINSCRLFLIFVCRIQKLHGVRHGMKSDSGWKSTW
jgi:hypothetical protein